MGFRFTCTSSSPFPWSLPAWPTAAFADGPAHGASARPGRLEVHARDARRAPRREINDYYNQLGEGLGKIVPPQVTSVSRKPLTIALEEIEASKIEAQPLPDEAELAAAAALAAAAEEPEAE